MLLPTVLPGHSRTAGVGLFAAVDIPCGCVVWAPCDRCPTWTRALFERLPHPVASWLDEQGYWLRDGRLLLVCGHGHLMNHSCEATVLDYSLDFGVAVRDIEAGEEVTCDYRTFVTDAPWTMECHCGEPTCARRIEPQRDGYSELCARWSAPVEQAVHRLYEVPQPLHDLLVRTSTSYVGARDAAITQPTCAGGTP